jgi:uncharacterized protein
MNAELAVEWKPSAEKQQAELDIYRGSWWNQMEHRSKNALMFETFLFATNIGWRSGGLILIGMGLYKLGVFNATCSKRFYLAMVAIGFAVGLPLVAYGVYRNEAEGWSVEYSFFIGPLFNYWGSILVALGWVGVVMLICQHRAWHRLTAPLSATGRMALSCYLLQSILATSFYNGHGLGWFGYHERWQQYVTVVVIWIVCLIFASVWLRYFRFGPMEWLWRSLTYWKLQPLVEVSMSRQDSSTRRTAEEEKS